VDESVDCELLELNGYQTPDPQGCGAFPTSGYTGWGWGSHLLPYLEQQAVFDQMDFRGNDFWWSSVENREASKVRIDVYLCPSDPQDGELLECCGGDANGNEDVRQTNIVGVCDSQTIRCSGGIIVKAFEIADGMMGNLQSCRVRDVTDGLSNTLMLGEHTGAGPGSHRAASWTIGSLWHTSDGINGPFTIPGGADQGSSVKGFSSYHPGGCHFAMGDGSVQFLSETIAAEVLANLTTRAGGEVVSGGSF